MEREPDEESRLARNASAQFALGHKRESDAALTQLTKLAANNWASGIASVHAIRNEPDEVFEWLDRAYVQGTRIFISSRGIRFFVTSLATRAMRHSCAK